MGLEAKKVLIGSKGENIAPHWVVPLGDRFSRNPYVHWSLSALDLWPRVPIEILH